MTSIPDTSMATRPALARTLTIAAAILTIASVATMVRFGMDPGRVEIDVHMPPPWLAIHLICVIPAVPLGGYILLRRKGDATHKMLGRIWGLLMIGAALSSFGLTALRGGAFSPIHILSVLTLFAIPKAIWNIRHGNVAGHKGTMTRLYMALIIAGMFSFLPGRLMWKWLMG